MLALTLVRGRRLHWAPRWDCSDEQVLFDGASGDYWLLGEAAAALVRRLAESGPLAWSEGVRLLGSEATLRRDAAALQRCGLLHACDNGRAVRLSADLLAA